MNTFPLAHRKTALYLLFNIVSLAFIYFVPTISHLASVPLYFMEPMRMMLILAIVHTSRPNAYIMALTLPLFSFLVSAHPHFLKMMLITSELLFNVWVFYSILNRSGKVFAAIVSSIVISKVAYYALKLALMNFAFLPGANLVATPIYIQVITTLAFSFYLAFLFKKHE